jgi:hypothetical protein
MQLARALVLRNLLAVSAATLALHADAVAGAAALGTTGH